VLQGAGSMLIICGLIMSKLNILPHNHFIVFSYSMLSIMVGFSVITLYWYIKGIVQSRKNNSRLVNNILKTAFFLLIFQLSFIAVCAFIFETSLVDTSVFILICIAFHGIILFGMLKLKHFFTYENRQTEMEKINISNILSLFRLSSGPTLLFLYLSVNVSSFTVVIVIIFTALVFITDLLDGLLARSLNQLTKIGKYLDATSDYMILFLAAIFFLANNIIPFWFFILLFIRLLVVFAGNAVSFVKYKNVVHLTSFLGKASVFSLMILFALKIFVLFIKIRGEFLLDTQIIFLSEENMIHIVNKVEYMVTGVLIITIVEKTMLIIKSLIKKNRDSKN
jgi:phosphatidylglycerophosphate synthase